MPARHPFIGPLSSGTAVYPAGATFGPRRMREYEFVWMIEGDAVYEVDGEKFAAPQGSIVLCRPGTVDAFRWDISRPTRHGYYHFGLHSHPRGLPPAERWPVVRMADQGGDLLVPLFKHLINWADRGDRALCRLNMELMLRGFVLGRSSFVEPPSDPLPEAVERALAFIKQQLDADAREPISLDQLADAAGVTPSHLCRAFSAATGLRPIQTVQMARLDRAATLICRSNFTLKQIAHLCGFSSAFHLSRRFTEAFKRSPREMRKHIEAGQSPPLPLLIRHPGVRG